VLAFLSQTPIEYEPEHIESKAHIEGKHLIPALIRARFVGASRIRGIRHRASVSESAETSRAVALHHQQEHWRSGYWRQQPCGPGRTDRQLRWIDTYRAGGGEREQT